MDYWGKKLLEMRRLSVVNINDIGRLCFFLSMCYIFYVRIHEKKMNLSQTPFLSNQNQSIESLIEIKKNYRSNRIFSTIFLYLIAPVSQAWLRKKKRRLWNGVQNDQIIVAHHWTLLTLIYLIRTIEYTVCNAWCVRSCVHAFHEAPAASTLFNRNTDDVVDDVFVIIAVSTYPQIIT